MNLYHDFNTEIINGALILTVNFSRATYREAREFNNLLSDAAKNGINKLLIEMHEVDFIDSTFLGVLVINLKKVMKVNGKLRLIGLKTSVYSVIKFTNLAKTFEIFGSKEEALEDL